MSGFVIWTRGLKGPELSKIAERVMANSDYLKEKVIGQPIPLRDGEWGLPIDKLREIYPAPTMPD